MEPSPWYLSARQMYITVCKNRSMLYKSTILCFTDLAPRERIAGAISALCFLLWPKHKMDPKAQMPSTKRQLLAAKITNCIFEYQDVAICYADYLQAFMFMDLTDDEKQWKTICTHEST